MLSKLFSRRSFSRRGTQTVRTRECGNRRFRFESLEARAMLSVNGDFNGDGYDDLAISASNEAVGTVLSAGAVNIIYGTRKGLHAMNAQFWHQNSPGVNGVAAQGDAFGYALAVGDFNGDGYSDLAIGVPGEKIDGKEYAGAVNVLYGSRNGLRATGDQLWTQTVPE